MGAHPHQLVNGTTAASHDRIPEPAVTSSPRSLALRLVGSGLRGGFLPLGLLW
jgi:hypothetical protein